MRTGLDQAFNPRLRAASVQPAERKPDGVSALKYNNAIDYEQPRLTAIGH
jgi:hypothetical protein